MKKVFLLLASLAIVCIIKAQTEPVLVQDQPKYSTVTQSVPNPLVNNVINITNTNGGTQKPVIGNKRIGNKPGSKIYFITNHNYYGKQEDSVEKMPAPGINQERKEDNSILGFSLKDLATLILLLALLIALLMMLNSFLRRRDIPITSAPTVPIEIHNHIPPAPEAKIITAPKPEPVKPLYDMKELVTMAHTLGGDLTVNADGGFHVLFMSAEDRAFLVEKKKEKKEQS